MITNSYWCDIGKNNIYNQWIIGSGSVIFSIVVYKLDKYDAQIIDISQRNSNNLKMIVINT